jgi:adenylate cyclase class 2
MIETEVKIKIEDVKIIKEKIEQLGAKLIKDCYLEENILYDFPDNKLRNNRQALRLRHENKKSFLTFKGPPLKSRRFKIREEYETEVKNVKQAQKILKALGLIPSFSYHKNRSLYKKKNLKICVDETPIGNFLELEGKRAEIVGFAKTLGFAKTEFIKLDYIQLMNKKRGKV